MTLGKSVAISCKMKHMLAYTGLSSSIPRYLSKRNEDTHLHKDLGMNTHSCFIPGLKTRSGPLVCPRMKRRAYD